MTAALHLPLCNGTQRPFGRAQHEPTGVALEKREREDVARDRSDLSLDVDLLNTERRRSARALCFGCHAGKRDISLSGGGV